MRVLVLFLVLSGAIVAAWTAEAASGTGAFWTLPRWSPYLCGILIGLLNALALVLVGDKLGASTQYTTVAGYADEATGEPSGVQGEYWKKNPPSAGWGIWLIVGVVLGALVSALLSGEFRFRFLPDLFRQEFGAAWLLRVATALAGGALLSFGARMAGGCTSGHGLSGTSLLNLSSWVALVCFFVGGLVTAFALY